MKNRTHATPAEAPPSKPIPDRDVIEHRLDDVRQLIWQVQGACSLASKAGNAEGGGAEGFATDVWKAMEGAANALDHIAGLLEPAEILKSEGRPS